MYLNAFIKYIFNIDMYGMTIIMTVLGSTYFKYFMF